MKYLSTVLIVVSLTAMVVGFGISLASFEPQPPPIYKIAKAPRPKKHRPRRVEASAGLPLPIPAQERETVVSPSEPDPLVPRSEAEAAAEPSLGEVEPFSSD